MQNVHTENAFENVAHKMLTICFNTKTPPPPTHLSSKITSALIVSIPWSVPFGRGFNKPGWVAQLVRRQINNETKAIAAIVWQILQLLPVRTYTNLSASFIVPCCQCAVVHRAQNFCVLTYKNIKSNVYTARQLYGITLPYLR